MSFPVRAWFVTALFVLVFALAACVPSAAPVANQPANAPTAPARPTPPPAADAATTPEPPSASSPISTGDSIRFVIDPAQSEVRFTIDEELMGKPKTVVGVNQNVSGAVTVNPGDPTSAHIGPIAIDTASFVTDGDRRNRAIHRFILQSSRYPTITFAPMAIEGIPSAVAVGDTLNLQVTGDLTVRDTTRSETFAVDVQVVSADELHVSGAAQVLRENYKLTIPSVPNVANVTNEVQLEFEFVATAQ